MSSTLVCPQCRVELTFKKPVIASTKIKCKGCGAKFYAGKTSPARAAMAGGAPGDAAMTPPERAPALLDIEPAPKPVEPRRQRIKIKSAQPWPKWATPAIAVGVVGLIILGIVFGQKPPPVPEPTTTASATEPANPFKAAPPAANRPAVGTDAILIDVTKARRPAELIGVWKLEDPAGGTLELAADGSARIQGPFLKGPAVDFTSTWFVMNNNGVTFNLEFGSEPLRVENHRATVRLQTDGRLKLLKYANSAEVDVTPRVFKKAS